MSRSARVVTVLIVACFTAGGVAACGQSGDPSGTSPESESRTDIVPDVDFVTFLRQTNSFDYEPTSNPAEVRELSDIAVLGTIESVEDGRVVGEPGRGAQYFVRYGIRPEVIQGTKDTQTVYFELRRPDNVGVRYYQAGLSVGTRVFLAGENLSSESESDGMITYSPLPEGLFIEGADARPEPLLVGRADLKPEWLAIKKLDDLLG